MEGPCPAASPLGTDVSGQPESRPISIFLPLVLEQALLGELGLFYFVCFIPKHTNKPEGKSLICFAWKSWTGHGNGRHRPEVSASRNKHLRVTLGA